MEMENNCHKYVINKKTTFICKIHILIYNALFHEINEQIIFEPH